MANSTDRSDLPPAELNPLLNPRLANNMGRWAETYFNAIPEKREEAVQALLQELEAEEAQQRTQSEVSRDSDRNRLARESASRTLATQGPFSRASVAESRERAESGAIVVCSTCGHENAMGQKFCGMCGVTLQPEKEVYSESTQLQDDAWPQTHSGDEYRDEESVYDLRRYGRRDDGGENLDRMFELQPTYSSSFRIFIAAAVAIVAVVLAIVAWRSGQVASAIMRIRGEVPAATTQQPAATPQTSAAPQNSNAQDTAAPNTPAAPQTSSAQTSSAQTSSPQTSPEAQASTPPPPAEKLTRQDRGERPTANEAAPRRSPYEPQPVSSVDNGAQELATAQQFANAGNRAEAAQWLWKSVAKRNLEATVLLSDSYLRGDGVAKSCEQARILLDAAAVRGSKEAGVRLRNMQAFGCR